VFPWHSLFPIGSEVAKFPPLFAYSASVSLLLSGLDIFPQGHYVSSLFSRDSFCDRRLFSFYVLNRFFFSFEGLSWSELDRLSAYIFLLLCFVILTRLRTLLPPSSSFRHLFPPFLSNHVLQVFFLSLSLAPIFPKECPVLVTFSPPSKARRIRLVFFMDSSSSQGENSPLSPPPWPFPTKDPPVLSPFVSNLTQTRN